MTLPDDKDYGIGLCYFCMAAMIRYYQRTSSEGEARPPVPSPRYAVTNAPWRPVIPGQPGPAQIVIVPVCAEHITADPPADDARLPGPGTDPDAYGQARPAGRE